MVPSWSLIPTIVCPIYTVNNPTVRPTSQPAPQKPIFYLLTHLLTQIFTQPHLQMKEDLNFFSNGRRPQIIFSIRKTTLIFLCKIKDDLSALAFGKGKLTFKDGLASPAWPELGTAQPQLVFFCFPISAYLHIFQLPRTWILCCWWFKGKFLLKSLNGNFLK